MFETKKFNKLVDEYVEEIRKMPNVKKHLGERYISGSSTEVSPITLWQQNIEIQWSTDSEPTKTIEEIEELGKKLGLVEYVSFWKSDGSCPSHIYIRLSQCRFE